MVSIISIIINLQLDLPQALHYIIGLGTLFLAFIYLRSRLFKKFHIWLFIISSLAILGGSWLYNEGPSGSINYLYILAFIIFLSISARKWHLIISIIIIANLLVLYLIYYLKPGWVHGYATAEIRESDMLFTYTYVILFSAIVFSALRRNYEIEKNTVEIQKTELEAKNKHITDSIVYAKEIQQALLQDKESIRQYFDNYFIFWEPKDIVSGDFYSFRKFPNNPNKVVFAVSDCTGHGVPGALITMLGLSLFNEIFLQYRDLHAHDFLQILKEKLKESLKHGNEYYNNRDGMDMAICIIDKENKTLEYSGANRPLILIRNGELIELKGNRMTVGPSIHINRQFKSHVIDLLPGDAIYLYTDGYADQFGEKNNEKFYTGKLKKLLLKNSEYVMPEQERLLRKTFFNWKGTNEQTDDVLVVGIKPNLEN